MDLLIHFDEQGFNNDRNGFKAMLPYVQHVVDTYNAIGLPRLLPNEFTKLLSTTEELIFDKMTDGKEVSIAGLKVHKKKALEILQKPEGYEALLNAVQEMLDTLKNPPPNLARSIHGSAAILHHFDLNESGEVVLRQSFVEELEKQHRRYAKSEKAKKMLVFAQGIIKACDDLGATEFINRNPDGLIGALREIIEGGGGKPLAIRTQGIVNLNQQ